MKKSLILFLTSIFALCSCAGTPIQEEQPHGEVTSAEEVTEPVSEAVIREFKDEDFAEIPVKIFHNENIEILNITEYDLNGLDLGDEISPCILPENIEKTIKSNEILNLEWEQVGEKLIEEAKKIGGKGEIKKAVKSGDDIYLLADYDPFCRKHGIGTHRIAFFAYHIPDGTLKKIYSYSDAEETFSRVFDMTFFDGALWIVSCKDAYEVARIDIESGEVEKKLTLEEHVRFRYVNGELTLTESFADESAYYAYDRKTGKFELVGELSGCNSELTGKGIVRDEITEGECTIIGEDFRLETGMRCHLMAAGENTVTVGLDGAGVVYTYDLEKLERYDLNISDLGTSVEVVSSAGDDVIVRSRSGLYYMYLMPRYGLCRNMYSSRKIAELSESADSYCFFVTIQTP